LREEIISAIEKHKVIVIVRGASLEQAVLVAKAVYDGGIRLIEVTFNQKDQSTFLDTVKAIKGIKENFPDMFVGAGTVLNKKQVDLAISGGATFIVSPDTDEKVIKYTIKKGLVSLPGAFTASEAKKAHDAGADFIKLFQCSDENYLKAIKAPLSHLKFLAVGGVNVDNAVGYIKAGAVGVGLGSSLINKKCLEEGDYQKITDTAKLLVDRIKNEFCKGE